MDCKSKVGTGEIPLSTGRARRVSSSQFPVSHPGPKPETGNWKPPEAEKNRSLRGQYFSFDAIIGSIIFILAIVMLLATWNSLRTSLDHQSTPLSLEALRIGDTLLAPGNPSAAQCVDMETLGLAISWEDRRLNDTKLISCAELSQAGPEEFQQRLGSGYPVSVFMNGIHIFGEDIQALPVDQLQEISHARRIASMYNSTRNTEEIVTLDIYVYR